VAGGAVLKSWLELATLVGVAIEVDVARLPVPPERADDVRRALKEETETPFAFAGRVTAGAGVHVRHDGDTGHDGAIRCDVDALVRRRGLRPRQCQ
jgi:hypothetical protein